MCLLQAIYNCIHTKPQVKAKEKKPKFAFITSYRRVFLLEAKIISTADTEEEKWNHMILCRLCLYMSQPPKLKYCICTIVILGSEYRCYIWPPRPCQQVSYANPVQLLLRGFFFCASTEVTSQEQRVWGWRSCQVTLPHSATWVFANQHREDMAL